MKHAFFILTLISVYQTAWSQTFYGTPSGLPTSLSTILDERIDGDYQVIDIDVDSILSYIEQQSDTVDLTLVIGQDSWQMELLKAEFGSHSSLDSTVEGVYKGNVVGESKESRLFISSFIFNASIVSGSNKFKINNISRYGSEFSALHNTFVYHETQVTTQQVGQECETVWVELGVIFDDDMLNCQNGSCFDNSYGDEDVARLGVLRILSEMEEFWQQYFDIRFVVRGPYYLAGNLPSNMDALSWSMNGYWNGRPCENVDALFLFTGTERGGAGQAIGGLGPDQLSGNYGVAFVEVKQRMPDEFSNITPHYVVTAYHEIAHLFGADHIDDDPDWPCADACIGDNAPLMCTLGPSGTNDNVTVSTCTRNDIAGLFVNQCDLLSKPVDDNCTSCVEKWGLVVDSPSPLLIGCSMTDIVTVTASFANDCDENQNVELIVVYNTNHVEIVEYDNQYLMLNSWPGSGDESIRMIATEDVGGEELLSISFTARVIGASPQNKLSLRFFSGTGTNDFIDSKVLTLSNYTNVIGNQSVSSLSLAGMNLLIDGELEVDQNFDFKDVKILLTDDSKIVVADDIEFNIIRTDIAACTYLWESIEINDGAVVNIDESNISNAISAISMPSSGSLLIKNSTLSDNITGVSTTPNSNAHRSIIIADGTVIKNGLTALDLSDVSGLHLGSSEGDQIMFRDQSIGVSLVNCDGYITNSNFHDIVAPPWAPIFFNNNTFGRALRILSDGTHLLSIDGGEGKNVEFANCDVGLYTQNSNTMVGNSVLTDCEIGFDVGFGWLNDISFSNSFISAKDVCIRLWPFSIIGDISNNYLYPPTSTASGIELINAWGDLQIRDNEFFLDGNVVGLRSNNVENVIVSTNNIYTLSDGTTNPYGMNIHRSQNMQIGCNEMFSSKLNGIGIGVQDSPGINYRCNKLIDFNTGIQFQGMCVGSKFLGQSLYDTNAGLLLGSDITGSESIIGKQSLAGNLWLGTFNWKGAFHYSTSAPVIISSRFEVNSNNANTVPPNLQELVQLGWFDDLQSGTHYDCSGSIVCEGTGVGDFPIPFTSDTFEVFDDTKKYVWGRQLYNHVLNGMLDTVNNQIISSFIDANRNTNIGRISDIETRLRSSFNLSNIDSLKRASYFTLRAEKLDSLKSLVAQALGAIDVKQISVHGDIISLVAELDSIENEHLLWVDAFEQSVTTSLNALALENQALSSTKTYELNEITVTDILLKSLIQDSIKVNAADSISLYQIASQCAFEGGIGVYRARALYAIINPILDFDDQSLCGSSNHSQPLPVGTKIVPEGDYTISLFPNPVRIGVNLTIESEMGINRIDIFDSSGRLMMTKKGTMITSMATSNLNPGLHVVITHDNAGSMNVSKLSVIE